MLGMHERSDGESAKKCLRNLALSHLWALLLENWTEIATKPAAGSIPDCAESQLNCGACRNKPSSWPEEEQAEVKQGGSYSCIVLAVP